MHFLLGWKLLLGEAISREFCTSFIQEVKRNLACVSYHIRNVPGLSTIEMSPGYHAGEKAGVFISASLVSKDDCRQESDEACLPQP